MRALDAADVVQVAVDAQVLRHRQPVRQGHVGRGEIHPRQCREPVARHVVAEDADAAGGRDQQAEQHGDGGGLAGAVAAEQADGRAARHREVDVVDRQRLRRSAWSARCRDHVHARRIRRAAAPPPRARMGDAALPARQAQHVSDRLPWYSAMPCARPQPSASAVSAPVSTMRAGSGSAGSAPAGASSATSAAAAGRARSGAAERRPAARR